MSDETIRDMTVRENLTWIDAAVPDAAFGDLGPGSPGPKGPRRKSHGRYGRGDDHVPCAVCGGGGEVCNPLNADPATRIEDWHPPVLCPRCGATGKDPNP